MRKPRMVNVLLGFMLLMSGILAAGYTRVASAHSGNVTIGVLDDMSGPYKSIGGPGAVTAARMAINDFGGKVLGKPIKLISANHQDKPDIASTIAREWIDEKHVNLITGLDDSAVAIAVQKLASEKHVITMSMGASAMALTNKDCTKYGIQYVYDTHALAAGTARAVVKQGGKSWYFITVNYAFGKSLQKSVTKFVKQMGGKVLGSSDYPLGSNDFSSYLLTAKASGADVIALANGGQDFVNSVQQAHEFGLGNKIVGLLVFLTNIKSLGLNTAHGLEYSTAFLWNRTPKIKKWSERFYKKHGAMPTQNQVGVYSAVLSYLKAVKKAGTDNSKAVRKELGKMTINDIFMHNGHIESNGSAVHDMYLVKVKTPKESRGPWDLIKLVRTVPAKQAFRPLSDSTCHLLGH